MFVERLFRQQQLNAEALAGAVVLEDERKAERTRRRGDIVLADRRERRRRFDAEFIQRLILRDFRDFKLERALAVDNNAAMTREPRQHGRGELWRIAMITRVRGSTHAVVEHAGRRLAAQVED